MKTGSKEIGSYRLVAISNWVGPSEMEYDSMIELKQGIREYRNQQYLVEGYVDFTDGTSDKIYPA